MSIYTSEILRPLWEYNFFHIKFANEDMVVKLHNYSG